MVQLAGTSKPKKVVVLGGDGFCGWPTSLYLSDQGHQVIIVDNLSRRKIDIELGCDSLTPIASAENRIKVWNQISGQNLQFKYLDLQHDYAELKQFLIDEEPDTVVHFAEQRAAPYSMKDERRKRYTIDNNLSGTHNLLCAIVESGLDIHVVHLGTMGVYGYGTSGMYMRTICVYYIIIHTCSLYTHTMRICSLYTQAYTYNNIYALYKYTTIYIHILCIYSCSM